MFDTLFIQAAGTKSLGSRSFRTGVVIGTCNALSQLKKKVYIYLFIYLWSFFERGKKPEAKATVFPRCSFCYHDNIYYLQRLKPVFKHCSIPNKGWNSILPELLTRFKAVFSLPADGGSAGAAGRAGCWEDAPISPRYRKWWRVPGVNRRAR